MKYFVKQRLNTLKFALDIKLVIFAFVQKDFNNDMTFGRDVRLNINPSKTERNYCVFLSLNI